VTVVGYASADRAVRVDALPAPDTTAVVRRRLSRPWPRLGGCAPLIAVHLARAGVPAACATWVAADAPGRGLLEALRAAGVDVAPVAVGGTRTAESFLVYDAPGRAACFYDPGDAVAGELAPPQRAAVAGAAVVCLAVGPAPVTAATLDAAAADALVVWAVKADPDAYPPPRRAPRR
jgi:sugar/nucleoside kinase (ribokinase family)